MEVVEITENCFNFVMSMNGNSFKDYCIFDCNNNVIAFKRFTGNTVRYYGLIENKNN